MTLDCSSLGLVDVELALCNSVVNAANVTTLTCPGSLFYTLGGACFYYTSPQQKVAGVLGDDHILDTGNNAFMMFSAALVFIMTPAVGLFYAGLAGEETSSNTLMMSFATMCIVTVQWFLFGYSFAFGPGNEGFGSFRWGALWDVGKAPSGAYGFGIPHITFATFQLMFAIITPAIISGALIGRMKFGAYMLFVAIWTTVVYDTLAHWVWSVDINAAGGVVPLGWLGLKGSIDFAGGAVIHISSGFAALACALVLGKRKNYGEEVKPHNLPLVIIGASFLWFGWFGFNAGSAGGAANVDGVVFDTVGGVIKVNGLASVAFLNTHIAACAGAISWMLVDRIYAKKISATGLACGAIAGLVAITPGAGFVDIWASIVFGLVVSPFCYFGAKIKVVLGIDDTLDSFALHGIGGMVGAFLTGLFATPSINFASGGFYSNEPEMRLAWNCVAICVCASFSFVVTLCIMLILKFTIGVRVSEDAEKEGIDVSEHGGKSYVH